MLAKANPPWANKLLKDNWRTILREVKDPMWMPRPATRDSAGKPKTFVELGCGHYGCVFSTLEPGIVFKISTDPSEAEFIKAAMKIGDWPAGIVRYHAVLEVEGMRRNRPVFVVWREEAFDVGNVSRPASLPDGLGDDPRSRAEWYRYHSAYRNAAGFVREASTRRTWPARLTEARSAAAQEWAWNNAAWEDGLPLLIGNQAPRPPRFLSYPASRKIAGAIRICQIAFELMEHTNYAPDVGAALGFYFDHGILIADVHRGNIGRVRRDDGYGREERIVITDPGHAVFLGGEGDE